MCVYITLNRPPLEGGDGRAVLVSVTVQLFGRINALLHGPNTLEERTLRTLESERS
jgi:hypothetical protein